MVLLKWLAALAVGAFGLWRFHITQFSSGFDTFPSDRGDGRLIAYLCEHWYQVFQNQAAWRSPAMFYPVQGTLGYADMFLAYAVPFSFLRALGMDIFTALSVVVVLLNYLSYVVCFVLLYKILRLGVVASCAGAFFFAFNSPKMVQMGHLQLQITLFLPLAFIFILLFVQKRESLGQVKAFGLLSLAVTSLSIQLMSGYYHGWYFIFWSCLFLALSLLFRASRAFILSIIRDYWRALLGSVLVFVLEMIPFLMVYVPVVRSLEWRPYQSITELIPVPAALLLMGNANYVWGDVSAAVMKAYALHPELQIGIGLVPSLAWLALTVAALFFIRRWSREASLEGEGHAPGGHNLTLLFLGLLVLSTSLFYLIGMRWWNGYSAWRLVYAFFPGGKSLRAISRYVIVLALPMAVVFAFLIQYLLGRISRYEKLWKRVCLWAALFAVVGFGLFEQLAGGYGMSIRAENSYLARLAKELPDNCGSFYVSVGPNARRNQFEYQVDAMLVSQMRKVPTMNGYSGQFPPGWFPGLWEVKAPEYENNMRRWIELHNPGGGICRLEIDERVGIENEIDDEEYFVRRQYLDLLLREPDEEGFRSWTNGLKNCPKPDGERLSPACDRAHVVDSFLQSPEFRINYFIYYFYKAVLGRTPRFQELNADRQRLSAITIPDPEAAMKRELIAGWLNADDFKEYQKLSEEEYVDRLMQTSGITLLNRDELVGALRNGSKSRADVLQEFLETAAVRDKFYKGAFVSMHYLRLLRRDVDESGYAQWLATLERTNDYRQVSEGFINSVEYRRRFRTIY